MNLKYTKSKILVVFLVVFLSIGTFSVIPLQATTQSSGVTFNSTNFELVNVTSTNNYNAFAYSYNLTSTSNQSVNWKIDINKVDGYTYKFDSLNGTVFLPANVSQSNSINYNFSLSGSYTVQVYWFSSSNSILMYKEYSAPNIVGLQNSTQINTFTYTYTYYWKTFINKNNLPALDFSFDIYFKEQHNVSLDYSFILIKHDPNGNVQSRLTMNNSKLMAGPGNSVQELTLTANLNGPGSYQVIFLWKDLLMYNVANLQRSLTFNFNFGSITTTTVYPGNPNVNPGGPMQPAPEYHYQREIMFPFSFFFSLIFTGLVFAFIIYAVTKNQKQNGRRRYLGTGPNQNNRFNHNTRNRPLVPSFCSNCGAKTLGHNEYCPDCGTKLD